MYQHTLCSAATPPAIRGLVEVGAEVGAQLLAREDADDLVVDVDDGEVADAHDAVEVDVGESYVQMVFLHQSNNLLNHLLNVAPTLQGPH